MIASDRNIDGNLAIKSGDNHALVVLNDERALRIPLAGRMQSECRVELTPENLTLLKNKAGEIIAGSYFEIVPERLGVKEFIQARVKMLESMGYCPRVTEVSERNYGFMFTKKDLGGID